MHRQTLPMAVLLLAIASTLGGCRRNHDDSPYDRAQLVVLTGFAGALQRCGCESKPLGGLERIVARVHELEKTAPTALLLSGSTFFEEPSPPPQTFETARLRAGLVAKVMATLNPRAIAAGQNDVRSQHPFVLNLAKDNKLPLFAMAKDDKEISRRVDSTLFSVGELKVGVVGVSGDASGEVIAISKTALQLRGAGADFVIALIAQPGDEAMQTIAAINGVDAAISGGSEGQAFAPRLLEDTLWLEAGNQGRYLGVLTLSKHKDKARSKPWVFDDGGETAQAALAVRIARLENDLQGMEEGPAKHARESKLVWDPLESTCRHASLSIL